MKIQIIHQEKADAAGRRVHCAVEVFEEVRDEKGPRPVIIQRAVFDEKGHKKEYIEVNDKGIAEIQVNANNMRLLQTLIIEDQFELYHPEDEAQLYRFGDFRLEILEEKEKKLEEKKKLNAARANNATIASEPLESSIARKKAELLASKPKAPRKALTEEQKKKNAENAAKARKIKAEKKIERENEIVEV